MGSWQRCKTPQPPGKHVWQSRRKHSMHLPCNPAYPLLGICWREMKTSICTKNCESLVALFIITQNWKQPQNPSAGRWMDKPWHFQTPEWSQRQKGGVNRQTPDASCWVKGASLTVIDTTMTFWDRQSSREGPFLPRTGTGRGVGYDRAWGCAWAMGLFYILVVMVMIAWLQVFVKTHKTVHLNR